MRIKNTRTTTMLTIFLKLTDRDSCAKRLPHKTILISLFLNFLDLKKAFFFSKDINIAWL